MGSNDYGVSDEMFCGGTPDDEPLHVEYRDIAGFPGYRVGDDGSVWSCWQHGGGRWSICDKWEPLTLILTKKGYHVVTLSCGGRKRQFRVGVLVLTAFVGNRPTGLVCCHDNGKSVDDRLVNLRWGTQKSNIADKWRHGTMPTGESHHMRKLALQQVEEIRRRRSAGERGCDLAKEFGVHPGTIKAIKSGRTWGWSNE